MRKLHLLLLGALSCGAVAMTAPAASAMPLASTDIVSQTDDDSGIMQTHWRHRGWGWHHRGWHHRGWGWGHRHWRHRYWRHRHWRRW